LPICGCRTSCRGGGSHSRGLEPEGNPDDAHFHHLLGHLLEQRGDVAGAVQAVAQAVELAPENADFRLRYSRLAGKRVIAPRAAATAKDPNPVSVEPDRGVPSAQTADPTQKGAPQSEASFPGAERVRFGKGGWLFHRVDDVFAQICGTNSLSPRNLSRLVSLWEARQAWCQTRGIICRTLIVPERHVLYPDKLPDGYAPHPGRPALQIIRSADSIRDAIIYPVEAIRRGREQREVCYRTDMHWSRYGAYLAYRELINSIPGCASRPVQETDLIQSEIRVVGDMTLWLDKRDREVAEFFEPPPVKVTELFTNRTFKPGQVDIYETENRSLPTLVLFRTSNSTHLLPFLYHHFSRIVAVATTAMHFDLLRSEKPNVVISEISERYLAAPHMPPTLDWIRFPRDFEIDSFTDFTKVPLPLPSGFREAQR